MVSYSFERIGKLLEERDYALQRYKQVRTKAGARPIAQAVAARDQDFAQAGFEAQ